MGWREELDVGVLTYDQLSKNPGTAGAMALYRGAGELNEPGTLVAGTTALHYSNDGVNFRSDFTVASFTVDTVAAANLALGKKVWTLPAGDILVSGGHCAISLTPTAAALDGDQPYCGIGTVIGSGAVAVLNGTTGFDDFVTEGLVSAVFSGANARVATHGNGLGFAIPAAAAHTVHVNFADSWTAQDATLACSATFTLVWNFM